MNLATPSSVQKLQTALHDKAKGSPSFRFYALYDKVYRKDVLAFAYACCKANGGAAGADGQTFEGIEKYGVERWLDELAEELRNRSYRPQPVRRVWIAKPDGKQRPLGVPTASANCTGAQIAFRMGGDLPSVPSTSRPALSGFEGAPHSRY
jgi:RNA-directed DNA polymerase